MTQTDYEQAILSIVHQYDQRVKRLDALVDTAAYLRYNTPPFDAARRYLYLLHGCIIKRAGQTAQLPLPR